MYSTGLQDIQPYNTGYTAKEYRIYVQPRNKIYTVGGGGLVFLSRKKA